MRITVVYEDSRYSLDVKPDDTVKDLKNEIRERFVKETAEDTKVGRHLEFNFGGASLQNDWVLNDISIVSGSVIKCHLKTISKPNLLIYLAYNNYTVLKITEDIDVYKDTVSDLKSIIAERLGIPVSIFRLTFNPNLPANNASSEDEYISNPSSPVKTSNGHMQEIFDTNLLDHYGVELGSQIRLDLWDGWNELILAAIAGHERVVRRYFSFSKPIRLFQQKVSLYIAADRGHIGLAVAMMKYGAKAHEPVGLYPGRKWCFESEHFESKVCPLHRACIRGHLPLLRLFVKSSPLCFITTDHLGRTPLQIVMHYRHRPCFEFLIARQWGRKSGKNISLPLIVFCRILRWSERAKKNVLLIHGTNKSTFKGVPQKTGALVGCSDLVIDGYGSKPANSLSFSEVNGKTSNTRSDRMLSVVLATRTKNRFLANKSRKNRFKPVETGKLPNTSMSSLESSSSVFNNSSIVSFTDAESNQNALHRQLRLPKTIKGSIGTKENKTSKKSSLKRSTSGDNNRSIKLPNVYQSSSLKESRNDEPIFRFTDDINSSFRFYDSSEVSLISRRPSKWLSDNSDRHPIMNFRKENTDPGLPLPARSIEIRKRPFFYWSPNGSSPNPVRQTLAKFQTYRGMASRQHAIRCVALSSSFTEKPWLQQIRMAASLSKRGVKKEQTLPLA